MRIVKSKYTRIDGAATIAIGADFGCRKGWQRNTPRLLDFVWRRYRPDVFIVAGDLSLRSEPYQYDEMIECLSATDAQWIAVPGDHDRPVSVFRKYFGSTRKVVDIGKWRFLGLNTADRMFLKNEEDWLEQNIKENSIIFSHMPPEAEGWTFHSLWPRSSGRFLGCVERHRADIQAMYFGHIHGYSELSFLGIPLVATGAVAESKIVRNNGYEGDGFFEMIVFDVKSGQTNLAKMY
jgi:Icc-related predicted phosphoesterase